MGVPSRSARRVPVKGRGFPYVNYLALAIIAAIIVLGMGVPDVRFGLRWPARGGGGRGRRR
jgi:hypothetical protein